MTMDRDAGLVEGLGKPPYPPSWIDGMESWVEGLPVAPWLFYLLGFVGFALFINVVFWIDGSARPGSIDPYNTVSAILAIYWPALYHYLSRVATRSLLAFRPLLDASESEVISIEYKFTRLPRWEGWLAIPLGFGIAIIQTLSEPPSFGDLVPKTMLPSVVDTIITGFIASAFLCLLIRSIRQLRMVGGLHARSRNINLLQLDPARSFSVLTSRTGIGVILLLLVTYAAEPLAFGSPASVTLSVATVIVAIGIFVLPIMGIQNRIEQEKDRELHKIDELLQSATDRLHNQVGSDNYGAMGDIRHAIEALTHERDLVLGVSTWPWNPRTLRGFASALLLPIFLWLVTRLLERIL
jgi:hypothetical protein